MTYKVFSGTLSLTQSINSTSQAGVPALSVIGWSEMSVARRKLG